jgi:excisionase family DNA binding protein
VIEVSGVLLSPEDARFAVEAFAALLRDRRPSAQLADFVERLRNRTDAAAGVSGRGAGEHARNVALQSDSQHRAPYDVLDSAEVAAIVGISPNGVRDLARRGRLPARRAGRRWLFPAPAVIAYAERRAARR